MQALILFLKGILLGIIVSIPIGPVGVLCINESIRTNWKRAFVSSLGATIGDGIFCYIAIYSLKVVMIFVKRHALFFSLFGGIFLLYKGLRILTKDEGQTLDQSYTYYVNLFVTAFVITITNPMSIVAFTAGFALLGINTQSYISYYPVFAILGVVVGTIIWWLCLSLFSYHFHDRIKNKNLLNRVSGWLLVLFGVFAIIFFFFDISKILVSHLIR